MLKFQFMMNVTTNTTKVTNKSKFRNINIPRSRFSLKFWFMPQQRTIWSNVTNNTTKVIGRHLLRSKSKKDLAHRNEKRKRAWALKWKRRVYPIKRRKVSLGPQKRRDEDGLAQGYKKVMIPKKVWRDE